MHFTVHRTFWFWVNWEGYVVKRIEECAVCRTTSRTQHLVIFKLDALTAASWIVLEPALGPGVLTKLAPLCSHRDGPGTGGRGDQRPSRPAPALAPRPVLAPALVLPSASSSSRLLAPFPSALRTLASGAGGCSVYPEITRA